jgi:hypothetical protein
MAFIKINENLRVDPLDVVGIFVRSAARGRRHEVVIAAQSREEADGLAEQLERFVLRARNPLVQLTRESGSAGHEAEPHIVFVPAARISSLERNPAMDCVVNVDGLGRLVVEESVDDVQARLADPAGPAPGFAHPRPAAEEAPPPDVAGYGTDARLDAIIRRLHSVDPEAARDALIRIVKRLRDIEAESVTKSHYRDLRKGEQDEPPDGDCYNAIAYTVQFAAWAAVERSPE